jgi:hypothetical protein
MILRGILDNSLGQLCIRGFAYLKDLEQVSRPDFTFQRNLIAKQKGTIIDFLENNPNLFFPEVILSFKIPATIKGKTFSIDPLLDIQSGKNVNIVELGIVFSRKEVKYTSEADSRGLNTTKIVTINIDNARLSQLATLNEQPFLRIDGNHRLSAASTFKERQPIEELVTPFCIIILNSTTPSLTHLSETFERIVFHNINSKSLPLTNEEIYKVILDYPSYFDDDVLLTGRDFGPQYLFARKLLLKLKDRLDDFPSLPFTSGTGDTKVETFRTVLVDLFNLLLDNDCVDQSFEDNDKIYRSIQKAEILYSENQLLSNSASHGLLVAFVYLYFDNNAFNITWFKKWVIENHLYELSNLSAIDLISIFNKMVEAQKRTIFISMEFGKAETNRHHKQIVKTIEEINFETNANIKLTPLRIDKFKDGTAYKIPDKILEKIETSGLLIADLTFHNANVYHEIGYLMGLNKAREKPKLNLILICNTSITKIPTGVGFNIRNHKILAFTEASEITDLLKEEITNYYQL